jgi:ferredoxin
MRLLVHCAWRGPSPGPLASLRATLSPLDAGRGATNLGVLRVPRSSSEFCSAGVLACRTADVLVRTRASRPPAHDFWMFAITGSISSARPPMNVHFAPLRLCAAARVDETVLDVARRAGAPLGNSCGGVGVCTRCRVTVVEGEESLSPPTAIELRFGSANGFGSNERMACQAVVRGDCVVTTTYW